MRCSEVRVPPRRPAAQQSTRNWTILVATTTIKMALRSKQKKLDLDSMQYQPGSQTSFNPSANWYSPVLVSRAFYPSPGSRNRLTSQSANFQPNSSPSPTACLSRLSWPRTKIIITNPPYIMWLTCQIPSPPKQIPNRAEPTTRGTDLDRHITRNNPPPIRWIGEIQLKSHPPRSNE